MKSKLTFIITVLIAAAITAESQTTAGAGSQNNKEMKQKTDLTFPVGFHEFNKNVAYNFQMNRFHSMGYARLQDFQEVGNRINSFDDWEHEMVGLAELALSEERIMDAAYYYRAAEFFIVEGDPQKEIFYNKSPSNSRLPRRMSHWNIRRSHMENLSSTLSE